MMKEEIQHRINRLLELYFSIEKIDSQTVKKFGAWFSGSEHIAEKYQALELIYEKQMGFDAKPSRKVLKSYKKISRRLGFEYAVAKPVLSFVRIAAVTLPLLVTLGTALYILHERSGHTANGRMGEKIVANMDAESAHHLVLPDSSSVWINGKGEIAYAEDFENHRVIKMKGEAYFHVEKHAEDLFVVETAELKATVKGTVFNINSNPELPVVEISLYEGTLDVERRECVYCLTAGQQLVYDKTNGHIFIRTFSEKQPRWMTNVLRFDKMKTSDILKRIGVMYGVHIVCKKKNLLNETITIRFEEDTPLADLIFFLSRMSNKFECRLNRDVVEITAKQHPAMEVYSDEI